MNPQEKIHLERKAVNPHDKNAVAVIRSATGEQIGWIPRECNTELAAILDKGMDCRVELIAVSGKPGGLYGVSVRVFYMDEVVSKVKKNQDIFAQDRSTAQKKKAQACTKGESDRENDEIMDYYTEDELFRSYLAEDDL